MDIATRTTSQTDSTRVTRALLACGVLSGPFFYVLAVTQILTRPGFDIRRNAISMLSLGHLGWIQITNFAMTGLLAIACAIGIRRLLRGRRAGTWGPVLFATYGMGHLVAALFHPDPGLGFPPGAAAAAPATMSGHATIHLVGFSIAFLAVDAACFVFSRLFASMGSRSLTIYCLATGVITPVLIVLGFSIITWATVIFAVTGVIAFGWVSAVAARLLAEVPRS